MVCKPQARSWNRYFAFNKREYKTACLQLTRLIQMHRQKKELPHTVLCIPTLTDEIPLYLFLFFVFLFRGGLWLVT